MKVGNNFMAVAFSVCNGSMTLQAEKIYLTIINNESKVNNMAKWWGRQIKKDRDVEKETEREGEWRTKREPR